MNASSAVIRTVVSPDFGQILDFEIFNHFDSGHSVQHIVKFSVSNLV